MKNYFYNKIITMSKIDLHVHSDYSDGSDSVELLAKNIIDNNIEIFALTDHDTTEGILDLEQYIPENIKFIKGIELTSIADKVKCHLLGYNCNPKDETLLKLIAKGKKLRRKKLEDRIEFLKEKWDIQLTQEELDWLYSRKSVVKTHFANILVKRGLSDNNVDAMKKYFEGCHTKNSRFLAEESVKAITKAGGIPIWAHPLGGEGEEHISQSELLEKLDVMKAFGIRGMECYYSRYNMEEINFLVETAKKNNLLISGGSDYHGTNKTIPLAKLNTENNYIDSCLIDIY